jgi:hypothetical protein
MESIADRYRNRLGDAWRAAAALHPSVLDGWASHTRRFKCPMPVRPSALAGQPLEGAAGLGREAGEPRLRGIAARRAFGNQSASVRQVGVR